MHSISKEQVFVNLFCFTFPPNKQKRINLPGQKNIRTYYFCRGTPPCSFPIFISETEHSVCFILPDCCLRDIIEIVNTLEAKGFSLNIPIGNSAGFFPVEKPFAIVSLLSQYNGSERLFFEFTNREFGRFFSC